MMLQGCGYGLAVLMGFTLGLMGTGGSMLTVPILVYCFQLPPYLATGYALFVVGTTAALGAYRYWRQGHVCFRDTVLFVLPSTLMITLTRRYIVPNLPDPIWTYAAWHFSKGEFIMSLLAFLMAFAGFTMLKTTVHTASSLKRNPLNITHYHQWGLLCFGSGMVGLLAGIVGAGGGFLMIPVLVRVFKLPMKDAIGTSLTIIMINSWMGFQGDLFAGIVINWYILGPFLGLALLGMFAGAQLSDRVQAHRLKSFLGYFMLLLSAGILFEAFYF